MTSRAADRPLRVLVPFSSEPHAARAPLTAVEGALGRGGRGRSPAGRLTVAVCQGRLRASVRSESRAGRLFLVVRRV